MSNEFNIKNGFISNSDSRVIGGFTANTISATTYQNLPVDPNYYVTAFTYSNNVFTIKQTGVADLTAVINTVTGWTVNGDLTATTISATTISGGTVSSSGDVTAGGVLKSTQSSGDEGGEVQLAIPQTNSSLSGASVNIDIYQNRIRIFEAGGSNRGVYIDITQTNSGVGSDLLTPNFNYGLANAIMTGTFLT